MARFFTHEKYYKIIKMASFFTRKNITKLKKWPYSNLIMHIGSQKCQNNSPDPFHGDITDTNI